jgi:hypothetical protein
MLLFLYSCTLSVAFRVFDFHVNISSQLNYCAPHFLPPYLFFLYYYNFHYYYCFIFFIIGVFSFTGKMSTLNYQNAVGNFLEMSVIPLS